MRRVSNCTFSDFRALMWAIWLMVYFTNISHVVSSLDNGNFLFCHVSLYCIIWVQLCVGHSTTVGKNPPKKCSLGKPYCLRQRLKSTIFEFFLYLWPWRGMQREEKKFKNRLSHYFSIFSLLLYKVTCHFLLCCILKDKD